jgi:hypothetical protein
MQEMDLDPTLAFTALIELAPELSGERSAQWKRDLMAAWYAQDRVTNFWKFARQWAFERKMHEATDRLTTDLAAAGDVEEKRNRAWGKYSAERLEAAESCFGPQPVRMQPS